MMDSMNKVVKLEIKLHCFRPYLQFTDTSEEKGGKYFLTGNGNNRF